MTSERHHFIVSSKNIDGRRFQLNGSEAHHLSRVARLDVGDEIFLLDLEGNGHRSSIEKVGNGIVSGTILETRKDYHESLPRIHLGIGILKGSRMETVVEKGTELGLSSVTPLIMRYNVKKSLRRERLEKIALSAVKQCGRGYLPSVEDSMAFSEWCSYLEERRSAVAINSVTGIPFGEWLESQRRDLKEIWFTVGPEGGYHREESEAVERSGLDTVTLGPRRLRSETAALAVLAACSLHFSGEEVV